jgi:hypothetical protein
MLFFKIKVSPDRLNNFSKILKELKSDLAVERF